MRERVDVHERLQPAGHRRGLHERVAAERQREDEQEHHALHRPGGAHRHADPQRDPRERQGEADRDAERREQQQRVGRDAEAEHVTEAHQDDAQQQVPEEVGEHRPDQRHRAADRQRPEAVEHALLDVGVHVLPDRDAAHRDRLADQAGQQELEVVVARAVGDRPAEHVQEQHQEDDRLQRDVDELLGRAGELDQVALAEHERVPQPRSAFFIPVPPGLSSWDLVPVRVKKTSSRLGRCSENSSTAIPAARSRATTSGSTSSPSTPDGHRAAPVGLRGAARRCRAARRAGRRAAPGRPGGRSAAARRPRA